MYIYVPLSTYTSLCVYRGIHQYTYVRTYVPIHVFKCQVLCIRMSTCTYVFVWMYSVELVCVCLNGNSVLISSYISCVNCILHVLQPPQFSANHSIWEPYVLYHPPVQPSCVTSTLYNLPVYRPYCTTFLCTVHTVQPSCVLSTLYNLPVYRPHCTTFLCTVHTVQPYCLLFTLYNLPVYRPHCTTFLCTVHTVQPFCVLSTLYNLTVYCSHCTTFLCTVHTVQPYCVPSILCNLTVYRPHCTAFLCTVHTVQPYCVRSTLYNLPTYVHTYVRMYCPSLPLRINCEYYYIHTYVCAHVLN